MTPVSGALVAQIREAMDAAHESGRRRPGRPTLVRLTGATDHAVRKALATLASTEPTADTPTGPATQEVLADAELTEQSKHQPTPRQAPDSSRLPRPWPLVIIGLAAAVAIWGGWVHLGELTGFGPINLFPGLGGGLTVNTAVVLPLSVEFYSAYALRVLLASYQLSDRTQSFAQWSFAASLAVGGGAQIASHVMAANHVTTAPWQVTTVAACVPLLVLGLASGLAALVKKDAAAGETTPQAPAYGSDASWLSE